MTRGRNWQSPECQRLNECLWDSVKVRGVQGCSYLCVCAVYLRCMPRLVEVTAQGHSENVNGEERTIHIPVCLCKCVSAKAERRDPHSLSECSQSQRDNRKAQFPLSSQCLRQRPHTSQITGIKWTVAKQRNKKPSISPAFCRADQGERGPIPVLGKCIPLFSFIPLKWVIITNLTRLSWSKRSFTLANSVM